MQRGLDRRFNLKAHYDIDSDEVLRKSLPNYVRVSSDKKSGVISVEVDDKDAKFAADLANAHEAEVTKLLGRIAVSEAQLRRVFFEKQLQETKENLVKAEQSLQAVQEKSGVIVLDKQAEALITNAALVRAQISEREVQLRVLRTSATEQNPAVMRLNSELHGLRSELARMESTQGGTPGSAVDMPVGRIPEAAIDYVRARRELKLQEALLEGMVRQYEIAKLDEAKEGPSLQQVDIALPPDAKAKPARALIVVSVTLIAFVLVSMWVMLERYVALVRRRRDPSAADALRHLAQAGASSAEISVTSPRGCGQPGERAERRQRRRPIAATQCTANQLRSDARQGKRAQCDAASRQVVGGMDIAPIRSGAAPRPRRDAARRPGWRCASAAGRGRSFAPRRRRGRDRSRTGAGDLRRRRSRVCRPRDPVNECRRRCEMRLHVGIVEVEPARPARR